MNVFFCVKRLGFPEKVFVTSLVDLRDKRDVDLTREHFESAIAGAAGNTCRGVVNADYVGSSARRSDILVYTEESNITYPSRTSGEVLINPQNAYDAFLKLHENPLTTREEAMAKYIRLQIEPGKGYVEGNKVLVSGAYSKKEQMPAIIAFVKTYNPNTGELVLRFNSSDSKILQPREYFTVARQYFVDHVHSSGRSITGVRTILRGFITASFVEDDGVYLDVICSSKEGGKLLKLFMNYCQHELGVSYISLNSLSPVLTFYPAYGFAHRKSCDVPPDAVASPEFVRYMRELDIEPTKYYDNSYIVHFLMELGKRGHAVNEHCDGEMSRKSFRELGCASDGFRMQACFGADVPAATADAVIPFVEAEPEPPSEMNNFILRMKQEARNRLQQFLNGMSSNSNNSSNSSNSSNSNSNSSTNANRSFNNSNISNGATNSNRNNRSNNYSRRTRRLSARRGKTRRARRRQQRRTTSQNTA